jgi:acyl carrier protein
MTQSEIESRIIELAAEQAGVGVGEVTRATHFLNDLHFDSLDLVEYAMEVEDELGVTVPDQEVEKLQTVQQVIDYVLGTTEGAAA